VFEWRFGLMSGVLVVVGNNRCTDQGRARNKVGLNSVRLCWTERERERWREGLARGGSISLSGRRGRSEETTHHCVHSIQASRMSAHSISWRLGR